MTIAVIRYPGTNNEHETVRAIEHHGMAAEIVAHYQTDLVNNYSGFWLAGGFSYGDVLRAGAIAGKSEIMKEIIRADKPIMGICNGFQILTEADVLPGALLPNTSTRFICSLIHVKIPENNSFLNELQNEVLRLPIAHFEGNLWSTQDLSSQVIAYYSDADGNTSVAANPNGSVHNIAGLTSADGRIVGMMPHPERACLPFQQSQDGSKIINAFIKEVRS